jgi:PTH1 family peptidyl-tRNA hydrolase
MTPPSSPLVVGLGNPGARYQTTRHNVGFLVVEELARRLGWTFNAGAGPWREAFATVGESPFTLLEPLTYMNLSGEAVAGWAVARGVVLDTPAAPPAPEAAAEPTGAEPADPPPPPPPRWAPLVICDDLSLPLGAARLRARGSSGGQKGLASVIELLGHEDFPRLRLGIAPVGEPVPPAQWPDFVLTPFTADETAAVTNMVTWAADAVQFWHEHGVEATASRFNRR